VSCLGWGTEESQIATVAELLLERPSPLPAGRVPLYICPEDGDVHCGAITAAVERSESSVVWRDFAYETGLDTDPEALDQAGLAQLGPFVFHVDAYEAAIRAGYGMGGFIEPPKVHGLLARFLGIHRAPT
jgi:hypothetical protein